MPKCMNPRFNTGITVHLQHSVFDIDKRRTETLVYVKIGNANDEQSILFSSAVSDYLMIIIDYAQKRA